MNGMNGITQEEMALAISSCVILLFDNFVRFIGTPAFGKAIHTETVIQTLSWDAKDIE